MCYKQNYYEMRSLNISFQRDHQQRVIRSNLSGYDVNNGKFDSINPDSVLVEYGGQDSQSVSNDIGHYFPVAQDNGGAGESLHFNKGSGPNAMLWSVNNQQYLSMQPSGSPSRNNGF